MFVASKWIALKGDCLENTGKAACLVVGLQSDVCLADSLVHNHIICL